MPDPIPVRVRDCACPDSPHADGDIVYLAPMLGFEGGLKAERQLFALHEDEDALTAAWGDTFIRFGATGWNLTDEAGEAVPFDLDAILGDYRLARPVADAAMNAYAQAIISPFVETPQTRSPTGRTRRTTSRRTTPTPTP